MVVENKKIPFAGKKVNPSQEEVDRIVKLLFESARSDLLSDDCWNDEFSLHRVGDLNKVMALSILQRHLHELKGKGKVDVDSLWNDKLQKCLLEKLELLNRGSTK